MHVVGAADGRMGVRLGGGVVEIAEQRVGTVERGRERFVFRFDAGKASRDLAEVSEDPGGRRRKKRKRKKERKKERRQIDRKKTDRKKTRTRTCRSIGPQSAANQHPMSVCTK